jgi:hypothetical protein
MQLTYVRTRHISGSEEKVDSTKTFRARTILLHFYIAGMRDMSCWRVRR